MNHIFIEERSLLRRVCNEIIQHELEFYGMHAFLTMKNVKLYIRVGKTGSLGPWSRVMVGFL